VTGAAGLGMSCLISKKFASKMSANHSQVLPGGIVGPVPFGTPGLVSAGWPRPAGTTSLLRASGDPVALIVIS
jgi:hypothetical protein